jgi:parallel beta-helix repeat protein
MVILILPDYYRAGCEVVSVPRWVLKGIRIFLCTAIVILITFPTISVPGHVTEDGVRSGTRYTALAPFRIDSNAELQQMAIDRSWPGDGSSSDPIVLRDISIDGSQEEFCLYMGNTTLHVIIVSCEFFNAEYTYLGNSLRFENCQNITIKDTTVHSSDTYGIGLDGCSRVFIQDTTVTRTRHGISIWNTDTVDVVNCTIDSIDRDAVSIYLSIDVSITGSVMTGHRYGVAVFNSQFIDITDNRISGSWYSSFFLDESVSVSLQRNTMEGGGIRVYGFRMAYWTSHSIDVTNTIGGRPVRYIVDRVGVTVPGGAGQVIVANCTDVSIVDQDLRGVSTGILAFASDRVLIDNTTVDNTTMDGITCFLVDHLTISNSTISRCDEDGLDLYGYYTDTLVFTNNTVEMVGRDSDKNSHFVGMFIERYGNVRIEDSRFIGCRDLATRIYYSTGLSISNNSFVGSQVGMELVLSFGNATIHENQFISNTDVGVYVWISSGSTTISNNTFWRNAYNEASGTYKGPQAKQDAESVDWDLMQYGNFWSDYSIRYPTASHDGRVWDVPYSIDGTAGAVDDFPLVDIVDRVPPVADAGGDITMDEDESVQLDGSGSHDLLGISEHRWTVFDGDGQTNYTGAMAEHVFEDPGTYEVTLTVTDLGGNTASDSITITVLDITPPVAIAGEDIEIDEGRKVTFNASGSSDNVGIVNWTWELEYDGSPVTLHGSTADFSFMVPGTYRVTLTVLDAAGLSSMDIIEVIVLDVTPPVASAGEDVIVDQGTVVQLNGTSSRDNVAITGSLWVIHFPEGPVELLGLTTSYRFDDPGEYDVTLNVTDAAGNWAVDMLTVRVRDIKAPVAQAGGDAVVDQHGTVTFDGTGSSDNVRIVTWTWTFEHGGEEVTLEGETPTHTFDDPGEYIVTLEVTDAAGNRASDEVVITVRDIEVPVAIAGEDSRIEENTTLTMDGSNSSDNVGIEGYEWQIVSIVGGETKTLEGVTVSYRFEFPGNYTVTLTVTDATGNAAEASFQVDVTKIDDGNGNGNGNGTGGGDDTNYMMYIIVAVILIAVLLGALSIKKRG